MKADVVQLYESDWFWGNNVCSLTYWVTIKSRNQRAREPGDWPRIHGGIEQRVERGES